VTPENIFVSFDGGVKILDFGIAKAANQVEMTRAGEIKGKLSYMSPEQCMGKPLDGRSDLFSLGVVLYEWVTGFKLFTGESDVAVLKSITEGKVYKPSYFKADVPEQVEAILMRALEKDPALRYQTAWEMQADLDTFLTSNEFTPGNPHLATFMKQLFADELASERARVSQAAPPSPSEEPAKQYVRALATAPGRGQQTKPSTDEAPLEVPFQADELAQLTAIAERHGLATPALVREIVQSYLRWR
jgi:serine/threonine protein kinase